MESEELEARLRANVTYTYMPMAIRQLLVEAAEGIEALRSQLAEKEAENKALREDKARLDFLDQCNLRLNTHYGTDYGWKLVLNHNVNRLMMDGFGVDLNDMEGGTAKLSSCRDAIDARRNEIARTALTKEGGRDD